MTLTNLEALARIRADRDGWWFGSEGFGCDLADADDEVGTEQAIDARDLQQAVWDLHFGVEPRGIAKRLTWVISEPVQSRLADLAPGAPADRVVAGHDIYPVSVVAYGTRAQRSLTIADRIDAYEAKARAGSDGIGGRSGCRRPPIFGLPVGEAAAWLSALVGGSLISAQLACLCAGCAGTAGETSLTGQRSDQSGRSDH